MDNAGRIIGVKEVTHDHLPRHHHDRFGDHHRRARSKEAPGQLTRHVAHGAIRSPTMAIKTTILGWLRRPPGRDEELKQAEIDARPGRRSSDKEDFIAAEKFGMRSREFEGGQDKPRH